MASALPKTRRKLKMNLLSIQTQYINPHHMMFQIYHHIMQVLPKVGSLVSIYANKYEYIFYTNVMQRQTLNYCTDKLIAHLLLITCQILLSFSCDSLLPYVFSIIANVCRRPGCGQCRGWLHARPWPPHNRHPMWLHHRDRPHQCLRQYRQPNHGGALRRHDEEDPKQSSGQE